MLPYTLHCSHYSFSIIYPFSEETLSSEIKHVSYSKLIKIFKFPTKYCIQHTVTKFINKNMIKFLNVCQQLAHVTLVTFHIGQINYRKNKFLRFYFLIKSEFNRLNN